MTNQSNLRPRLWSIGVTPPLPDLPSWCAEGKFAYAFEKIVGNTQVCSLGKLRGVLA